MSDVRRSNSKKDMQTSMLSMLRGSRSIEECADLNQGDPKCESHPNIGISILVYKFGIFQIRSKGVEKGFDAR